MVAVSCHIPRGIAALVKNSGIDKKNLLSVIIERKTYVGNTRYVAIGLLRYVLVGILEMADDSCTCTAIALKNIQSQTNDLPTCLILTTTHRSDDIQVKANGATCLDSRVQEDPASPEPERPRLNSTHSEEEATNTSAYPQLVTGRSIE